MIGWVRARWRLRVQRRAMAALPPEARDTILAAAEEYRRRNHLSPDEPISVSLGPDVLRRGRRR